MLIHHDPDEWKPTSGHRVCGFHQTHPGEAYAGCTCMSSFGQVRRDPAEVAAIKAQKRREHEDAVLAEAALIQARRDLQKSES